MLIPAPYASNGLHRLLEDAVGPDEDRPGGTWALWADKLPQHPLLVARSFTIADPHNPREPILDEHSRPIRLCDGIAIPGIHESAVLGPYVLANVRHSAADLFLRTVERETPGSQAQPLISASVRLRIETTRYEPVPEAAPPRETHGERSDAGRRLRRMPITVMQEIVRAITGYHGQDDAPGHAMPLPLPKVRSPQAVHLLELEAAAGPRSLMPGTDTR